MAVVRRLLIALVVSSLPLAASAANGRYIVKFRDPAAGKAAIAQAGGRVALELPEVAAAAAYLPEAALAGLSRSPAIEYVEEDAKRYLSAEVQPYGIDMVQAPAVWEATGATGVNAVRMCIIDSGLYTGHEDIQDASVSGSLDWNQDGCGHGTHVAGTVAALGNGAGVIGVNPDGIDLYIVRVFGSDCSWTYASNLIDAANRCQAAGAKVISMSLGGTFSSRTEQTAFANLHGAGILSVAAAGNDGNTRKSYPASYDSVISVAAVDQSEQHASFSQYNSAVELAAPGVAVLSTVPWNDTNTLTVGGTTYVGAYIDGAARTGGTSGDLVDGGLCDTAGSWSGAVVLCARGVISFYDKVMNVQAGGGAAAVIYNNEPGGFLGTLGDGVTSQIPAISLSQEDGQALVAGALSASGTVFSQFTAPGSGYEAWDGTSMATPHVSGVAALIWSASPGSTNVELREALTSTAKDLGTAGRDNYFGFGLVQAKAALDALTGSGGGEDPPPPTGDVSLTVSTYKVKGVAYAELSWSGATGDQVDLFRDGGFLVTTANDGAHTDNTGQKGGVAHTYQVCEAGSSVCSAVVQVVW